MHRFRHLVIGSTVAALALASLAGPVSANHQARLTIVNGIPGKTAEVCIGNKEVKNKLPYGAAAIRQVGTGHKVVKLRKPSAGKCKGKFITKKPVNLSGNDDMTVVFSKKQPVKNKVFDNTAGSGPGNYTVTWIYNMSDIVDPGFKYTIPDSDTPWHPTSTMPAVDDPWDKGQAGYGSFGTGTEVLFWAHQVPIQKPISVVRSMTGESNTIVLFILVGTHPGNAKFLKIKMAHPFDAHP